MHQCQSIDAGVWSGTLSSFCPLDVM